VTKGRRQRSPSNSTTNAAKPDANLGFVPSPLSPPPPRARRTAKGELAKPLFPQHPASVCAFARSLALPRESRPSASSRSLPDWLPPPAPRPKATAPRGGTATRATDLRLRRCVAPSVPHHLLPPSAAMRRPRPRRRRQPLLDLLPPLARPCAPPSGAGGLASARSCATGARCLRGRWLSRAAIASVRFFSCSVRIRLVSSVLGLGRPFRLLVCDI